MGKKKERKLHKNGDKEFYAPLRVIINLINP